MPKTQTNKGEFLRVATGTVKWFNDRHGYGFLRLDVDGPVVFFHHTGIARCEPRPKMADAVSLNLYKGCRGLYAREVRVTS